MQQRIIQLLLCLGVFFATWIFLVVVGPALVDTQAVLQWLGESEWLRFLNTDIRNAIFTQGWKPLAALMLAVLSYGSLKAPATYLASKFYPPTTYQLSEDAKNILKALHRPDYVRRTSGLSKELGFDNARITQGLNELAANGLVVEKTKHSGKFWKITYDGQACLKQLVTGQMQ
jgi:hypothetical protein